MKAILKIGYHEILLPSDKGLATIISALSKGVEVMHDRSSSCYGRNRFVEVKRETISVEVVLLPESVKVKPIAEPEAEELLGLPENGHRELLGLPEFGTRPN